VNQDGHVSYRELQAFVERANHSIVNERFRPQMYARAPEGGSGMLLDLRPGLDRHIEIDGKHAGHYYLETPLGVRVAEFHSGPETTTTLLRPAQEDHLFLRTIDGGTEYRIAQDTIRIADLTGEVPTVAHRGAAHEAFSSIFSVPFDRDSVDSFVAAETRRAEGMRRTRMDTLKRRVRAGWWLTGAGAVAAAGGVTTTLIFGGLLGSQNAAGTLSQTDVVAYNRNLEGLIVSASIGAAGLVAFGVGAGIALHNRALEARPIELEP
jgi:hypothetical protein